MTVFATTVILFDLQFRFQRDVMLLVYITTRDCTTFFLQGTRGHFEALVQEMWSNEIFRHTVCLQCSSLSRTCKSGFLSIYTITRDCRILQTDDVHVYTISEINIQNFRLWSETILVVRWTRSSSGENDCLVESLQIAFPEELFDVSRNYVRNGIIGLYSWHRVFQKHPIQRPIRICEVINKTTQVDRRSYQKWT